MVRLSMTGLLFSFLVLISCGRNQSKLKAPEIYTQDGFVHGLYTDVLPDSPRQVFAHVFKSLPAEITIYPSENIYYLRFTLMGKTYSGTITLYPDQRDSGKLGFGYVDRMENKFRQKYYPLRGGSYDFSAADGLNLKKRSDNRYEAVFEGKKLTFNLHPLPDSMPPGIQLAPDEEWVASTFDESGLQFHLLFHRKISRLFWVLREDIFVPESFHRISPSLLSGDRTEFVFYLDSIYSRKILVGVEGENVMQNNWYDGPFDHLPDNRIYSRRLNLQPYLELHDPSVKGKINTFGHFLHKPGRLAVAPYKVYFSLNEMYFADSLSRQPVSREVWLKAVTEQDFNIPADFYKPETFGFDQSENWGPKKQKG